jgi:ribosomal-protein-alanine N-acetyltransferase
MKERTSVPHLVGAGERELEALSVVHASSFEEPWSAKSLREMLETPGAFALALEQEGHADGFILLRAAADEAEIITFAVLPSARRRGLGRSLLEAAARHAHASGVRSLFLEVDRTNEAACGLYRLAGFEQVGARPAYYNAARRDGSGDALVMRAWLPLQALGNPGETD